MNYDDFIKNILETRGRFGIPKSEYKERHHIVPKCLGGKNDKLNLIDLYAKEHLIAHKLLVKKYPDCKSLIYAYHTMAYAGNKKQYKKCLSPQEYEELRVMFSKIVKNRKVSEKTKLKLKKSLKKNAKERNKKIGIALLGNKNKLNKKLSEESKRKISESKKGKKLSEKTKQKLSLAHIGLKTNRLGTHHTKESIEKMRIASLGKNNAGFGKHWFTNGEKNVRLSDNDKIPIGFFRGKTHKPYKIRGIEE